MYQIRLRLIRLSLMLQRSSTKNQVTAQIALRISPLTLFSKILWKMTRNLIYWTLASLGNLESSIIHGQVELSRLFCSLPNHKIQTLFKSWIITTLQFLLWTKWTIELSRYKTFQRLAKLVINSLSSPWLLKKQLKILNKRTLAIPRSITLIMGHNSIIPTILQTILRDIPTSL